MLALLGAHPGWIDDWGAILGAVVAAITLLTVGYKMIRRLDRNFEMTERTHHLVKYHLGPNGDTTPMHHRVARLEVALDIDDDDG